MVKEVRDAYVKMFLYGMGRVYVVYVEKDVDLAKSEARRYGCPCLAIEN